MLTSGKISKTLITAKTSKDHDEEIIHKLLNSVELLEIEFRRTDNYYEHGAPVGVKSYRQSIVKKLCQSRKRLDFNYSKLEKKYENPNLFLVGYRSSHPPITIKVSHVDN